MEVLDLLIWQNILEKDKKKPINNADRLSKKIVKL